MLDILNWVRERSKAASNGTVASLGLKEKGYLLTTVHRSENTDSPERLSAIVKALNAIEEPVIFPVHPRARKVFSTSGHNFASHVHLIDPLGYFDMTRVSASARMILTDSGGLQKEAYWLGVPCVTLRDETEWVETVETGWNRIVGTNIEKIVSAVRSFIPPTSHPELYGDGKVAERCVTLL